MRTDPETISNPAYVRGMKVVGSMFASRPLLFLLDTNQPFGKLKP